MAESMIGSLFGLSPEMYGEQQRVGAMNEGIALANLNPAARGAALTYAGAKGLGTAIGGAMGVQDPQLQLISARKAILGQIDQTNPSSLLKGAQTLAQMGDQQGAFALADYARKAQSEIAQAQQRLAAANRERQQAVPKEIVIANEKARITDQLDQLRMQEATPEVNRVRNILTTQLSELEKLDDKSKKTVVVGNALVDATTGTEIYKGPDAQKYSEFAKTLIDAGLTPGTEPFQKRMLEYATKKIEGVGKGTGNVTIGGINLDTGTAAKEASKLIGQNVANIETQFSLKTAFDDAIKLVNQGIYAGAYGPEKQFVAKFTGIGSPQKVENTEVFMSNIGEIVIPRLQQFGGNDSNEELKYLQKVVAGELRMEPKAMLRVLESAERKTRNNIERLQKQASGKPGEALPITPMNAPLGSPQNPIKLKDK